jgi:hypothetical protein
MSTSFYPTRFLQSELWYAANKYQNLKTKLKELDKKRAALVNKRQKTLLWRRRPITAEIAQINRELNAVLKGEKTAWTRLQGATNMYQGAMYQGGNARLKYQKDPYTVNANYVYHPRATYVYHPRNGNGNGSPRRANSPKKNGNGNNNNRR